MSNNIPSSKKLKYILNTEKPFLDILQDEAYKRLEISSSFRTAISSVEGYFLKRVDCFAINFNFKKIVQFWK